MHILVVEDDHSIADLLERVLREEGHDVELCTTLHAAQHSLAERERDVIVLDRMLPDGEGLELCASLRAKHDDTPILMLTALSEVHERVSGLRTGADDYLSKPFDVEELLARLVALRRRTRRSWLLLAGPLEIDRRARRVAVDGARIELTLREYELLERLALAGGDPVSRQTLLRDVWNTQNDSAGGALNVHISRLRDKLGRRAWLVETVHGAGYRLRDAR